MTFFSGQVLGHSVAPSSALSVAMRIRRRRIEAEVGIVEEVGEAEVGTRDIDTN